MRSAAQRPLRGKQCRLPPGERYRAVLGNDISEGGAALQEATDMIHIRAFVN